jgi:hypothetical protein
VVTFSSILAAHSDTTESPTTCFLSPKSAAHFIAENMVRDSLVSYPPIWAQMGIFESKMVDDVTELAQQGSRK